MKDLSSVAALLGPLFFIGFVFVILSIVARRGAFARLLRHYGLVDTHSLADKKRVRASSYTFDGRGMQNLHRFYTCRSGLYVRVIGLPFFKKPGFVIPWSEVRLGGVSKKLPIFSSSGHLQLGALECLTDLHLPSRAYRKVSEAKKIYDTNTGLRFPAE